MVTWRDKDGVERTEDRPGPKRIVATRAGMQRRTGELAKLHWYAIMVRAGTEFSVEALLERRGFVAVVPTRTVFRRVNRYAKRKRAVSFPLLARYVFVGFDRRHFYRGDPPWYELFSITMVQSVVGTGDRPLRMQGRQVAEFLKGSSGIRAPEQQRHMRTHREFAVGDTVEVVEGSLVGFQAKVHAINGAVAEVLLPLFGRDDQSIDIPLAVLEHSSA